MAKNVSVMALLAAVKRGFWKKRMSSIGVGVVQLPQDERRRGDDADDEPGEHERVGSSPSSGPSMMPNSSEPRPTIDSTAPSGSSLDWAGSRDVGIMK